jgi:translation initiation factor IF-2
MEAIGLAVVPEERAEAEERIEVPAANSALLEAAATIVKPETAAPARGESLDVVRKLTLDDVPRTTIVKPKPVGGPPLTKEEREVQLREQRLLAVSSKKQRRERAAAPAVQQQIKKKEGLVVLPEMVSVKELAEKMGVQVPLVIQALMKNGVMATITQSIDYDTAAIVAAELGITVQQEQRAARAEDLLSRDLTELLKDEPENLKRRPPIVVVMGHVDHGKTAILDAIRQTDVVSQEAGGITQHIGAYQVEHLVGGVSERITFLDTPGHQAFTAMRARGAQVGDIAVIVVSAEEGVKETTVEAVDHAREAGVPMLVAINKIDKERADPERVKGEIAAQGLQPEEWGGTTPIVLCSAKTKQGIPDLLDHIVLLAELRDLKANPNRAAVATVIESHLDASLGPVATVIVNAGTLRVGDSIVCGRASGRVRTMIDAHGALEEVSPSGAVRVSGLQGVPHVGDILQVVPSEREARMLLDAVRASEVQRPKRSFADLVSRLSEGKLSQLKVVLKADAQGSLEAIETSLAKLVAGEGEGRKVAAKVIHGGIGAVTESDVSMAAASDGIVLAFNVPVSSEVRRTAERESVAIRTYDVIYELLEEVDQLLRGLLEPEELEHVLGHLEVRGVFYMKKSDQIIGGRVLDGIVKRLSFRILREGKEIGIGRITSLKHVDTDIKEAKEGSECGLKVETASSIAVGDQLEVFVREFKKKA